MTIPPLDHAWGSCCCCTAAPPGPAPVKPPPAPETNNNKSSAPDIYYPPHIPAPRSVFGNAGSTPSNPTGPTSFPITPTGIPIVMSQTVYAQTTKATVDTTWINSQCNGAPDCIPDWRAAGPYTAILPSITAWVAPDVRRWVDVYDATGSYVITRVQSNGTSPVVVISTNQLEAEMQIIAQRATGARGSF